MVSLPFSRVSLNAVEALVLIWRSSCVIIKILLFILIFIYYAFFAIGIFFLKSIGRVLLANQYVIISLKLKTRYEQHSTKFVILRARMMTEK